MNDDNSENDLLYIRHPDEKIRANQVKLLDALADPDNIKKPMTAKGYQGCKSILPLQRHAFERRDVGMDQFIRKLLNDHDFEVWQNSSK